MWRLADRVFGRNLGLIKSVKKPDSETFCWGSRPDVGVGPVWV